METGILASASFDQEDFHYHYERNAKITVTSNFVPITFLLMILEIEAK